MQTPSAIFHACALDHVIVVIPTLNEANHIDACLGSLLGGTTDAAEGPTLAGAFRVVVADGGSTDATRQRVAIWQHRIPDLHLIDNPERLQSAGINRTVADLATPNHTILVRCDAHSVYPQGFVGAVAHSLAASGAASVVVPMDAMGMTPFSRAAAWVVDTPLGSGGAAHRGGRRSRHVDHGHHAGMDIGWFRRIGGYDATFSHNEDAEYDHRLGLAGGKVWLDAGIRLGYVMRPTPGALARQYWNYGRGRARTILKHALRPRLRQMIPVANLLGIIVSLLVAPALPVLLLWPLAYVAALAGVSVICAWRLGGAEGLWAGPALLVMHNFWAAGLLVQLFRTRIIRRSST